MSNVNTNTRIEAGQMAPIVGPTAATATIVQFVAPALGNQSSQSGNALLPIPGQYKGQNSRVRVRFNYSVLGATVGSQALTVAIFAQNNASTPVKSVVATTGAVACTTLGGAATIYLNLDVEMVWPSVENSTAADTVLGGSFSGTTVGTGTAVALVTPAVLTNQPNFTTSTIVGTSAPQGYDEAQYFGVEITLAETDATFTFTPLELSVEVL